MFYCNAMPEGTSASITGRRERKKRKFVSSFSASEMPHIPDALQYRQNELVLAARYPYHPDRTFDRGLWSIEVFGERTSCRRLTRHLSYQGPSLSSKPRACQTRNRGGGFCI